MNSVGEGSRSNERSATPTAPATVPGAPTLDARRPPATAASRSPGARRPRTAAPRSPATRSTAAPRAAARRCSTTLGNVTSYTDASARQRHDLLLPGRAPSTRVGEGARSSERSATPVAPATRARRADAQLGDAPATAASRSPGARPPRTAAPRSPATRSTAAPRAAARRCSTTLGNVTELHRHRPPRTGRPTTTRSAPSTRSARARARTSAPRRRRAGDRPRRADAQLGDRRQRQRRARLERARLQRRLRDHRLQGLPRHRERRRDAADHARHRHELHRHDAVERDDLLLPGHRRQLGRRGPRSNERSATPAAPATVPGAPTLNSATAGNGSVTLAWSAPASNGGSAITGYKVYRGTASGGETLLDDARHRHQLHRHDRRQRDDLLLPGQRRERRRRGRPLRTSAPRLRPRPRPCRARRR